MWHSNMQLKYVQLQLYRCVDVLGNQYILNMSFQMLWIDCLWCLITRGLLDDIIIIPQTWQSNQAPYP